MALHIDEIESEVRMEPAPQPSGERKPAAWEALARQRELHERLLADRERTSAFGNED